MSKILYLDGSLSFDAVDVANTRFNYAWSIQ